MDQLVSQPAAYEAADVPAAEAQQRPLRQAALRPRLAILSTTSELCGIAAYVRCLQRHIADHFDVTVFDLDQYLLRSAHPRVRRLGDRHVRDLCRAVAGFDVVNLQLEHGILGLRTADICRRLAWIVAAAPALTVTFHTVFRQSRFDMLNWLKEIARFDLGAAISRCADFRRRRRLSRSVGTGLRRVQRRKPLAVIVHNRRDRREMEYVQGVARVYDHPLSFLSATEAEEIRAAAERSHFPLLAALPPQAVLVGVFGFLSPYKGFETAIRAMQHLPADYHLLLFGAVHPNSIAPHQAIDPYVATLLDEAFVDATVAERLAGAARGQAPAVTVTLDGQLKDLLLAHPKDLSARVHFMGAMSDRDFAAGMTLCDAVVFPYREVGQSASGPISHALELGCRIIASRTRSFLEFARYHPDRIEFFDIGNHLELAKRLLAPPAFDVRRYRPEYDVESNRAVYRMANSGLLTQGKQEPLPAVEAPPRWVSDRSRSTRTAGTGRGG
ncbi:MAG TPA: hypothetical protein VFA12_04580 [Stellaceae bacterium]|nr:hypothetical protein [Stellaceae bacterium]